MQTSLWAGDPTLRVNKLVTVERYRS